MPIFIDKTIRSDTQWVKITRDNKNRTFTFARGYKNEFQSKEIQTFSFKWVPNWKEALEKAEIMIKTYA